MEAHDLIILYPTAFPPYAFSWVEDAHLYLGEEYAPPIGNSVIACADMGRTMDFAAAWVDF